MNQKRKLGGGAAEAISGARVKAGFAEGGEAGPDPMSGLRSVALLRAALRRRRRGLRARTLGSRRASGAERASDVAEGFGPSGARGGRARKLRDAVRARVEGAVLDLVRSGQRRAALTLLMATYGQAVYAFCLRIVKDQAHAEDVRQWVFLQAYEGLASFAGDSSLRTWLLSIAKFRSLDTLRALRREAARLTPDDGLVDEADVEPDPSESSDAARLRDALSAGLEGCLSAEDVRIVLMRYRDGLSYEEIGAALGKKPDTLCARVARALPKLRRFLQRRGIDF